MAIFHFDSEITGMTRQGTSLIRESILKLEDAWVAVNYPETHLMNGG